MLGSDEEATRRIWFPPSFARRLNQLMSKYGFHAERCRKTLRNQRFLDYIFRLSLKANYL